MITFILLHFYYHYSTEPAAVQVLRGQVASPHKGLMNWQIKLNKRPDGSDKIDQREQ